MRQLIFRKIEVCARCGAWAPFRVKSTQFTNGVKRAYLACRMCGARAIAVYTKPERGEMRDHNAKIDKEPFGVEVE